MRIWAFPSFYPFDKPGMRWAGIFAHRQYKGLLNSGAELSVVIPTPWHPPFPLSNLHPEWKKLNEISYPEQCIYDGVKVYYPRISNVRPNRFVKKSYIERYVDSIVNFFKRENIKLDPSNDIFYAQWIPDAAMVHLAAKKLGIKSSVLLIGDDVLVWPRERPENLKIFQDTWRNADLRLACAKYLGNDANTLLGADLNFGMVRWGGNYNAFKPVPETEKAAIRREFNLPADRLIILNVGTMIVRKGWLDLLDALKEIKKVNNNFTLIAAHAGKPDINMQAELKSRGLEDNFIDLGEVPPEKTPRVYNAADIFCLPSHWEGMANAVIEAMSSGLPTITTDVCGHPELIESGVTGILIPRKQPAILAEKLTILMNDEAKRKQLGSSAREFIVNEWGSFDDNAKILHSMLQSATL